MDKYEVVDMYAAGRTIGDICVELGCYPPQVYTILKREGVPLRGRVYDSTPQTEKVILTPEQLTLLQDGFKSGKPIKQIAREMHIPYGRALNAAKSIDLHLIPGAKPTSFTVSTQKQMVADYLDAKLTVSDTATKYGVSTNTLMRVLKANGVKKIRENPEQLKGRRMEVIVNTAVREAVREMKEGRDAEGKLVEVEQLGFEFPQDLPEGPITEEELQPQPTPQQEE